MTRSLGESTVVQEWIEMIPFHPDICTLVPRKIPNNSDVSVLNSHLLQDSDLFIMFDSVT